jgi:thiamine biosynthesis protein ThiI
VLFSPRHPVLRADLAYTREIYDGLKIDDMLKEAFDAREHKRFGWL